MNHSKFNTRLCAMALLIAILASLFCLPIGATELDGTLISYQVTDGASGTFSLRLLAGTNSLSYEKFGYEIKLTTKDADGNDVTETFTGESGQVYSSVYGGGIQHSIKETFGYDYAAIATVTGLDTGSQYTKIEVSTYFVLHDGNTSRGADVTLFYTGEANADGYPLLSDTLPSEPAVIGTALTVVEVATEIATIDWRELKN